jgi:hypothetical protein
MVVVASRSMRRLERRLRAHEHASSGIRAALLAPADEVSE